MTIKLPKTIKLVISDFDGIFTDGSVFIGEDGKMSKKINFADIMGVHLLTKKGIKFAIISGEKTSAIDYIKNKFQIEDIFQGIRKKAEITAELLKKYNINNDEVVYLGDDVNDIDSMQMLKYVVAPMNANFKVKELTHIQISERFGGNGVFREVVDNLIY